jgi:hypothetical protein
VVVLNIDQRPAIQIAPPTAKNCKSNSTSMSLVLVRDGSPQLAVAQRLGEAAVEYLRVRSHPLCIATVVANLPAMRSTYYYTCTSSKIPNGRTNTNLRTQVVFQSRTRMAPKLTQSWRGQAQRV